MVDPLTNLSTTSNTVHAQKAGDCGPMDIAIALDDTASMGGAIDNIRSELPSIINYARIAFGDDLRLGYITFKGNVTVHHPFTNNLALVAGSISGTPQAQGTDCLRLLTK